MCVCIYTCLFAVGHTGLFDVVVATESVFEVSLVGKIVVDGLHVGEFGLCACCLALVEFEDCASTDLIALA